MKTPFDHTLQSLLDRLAAEDNIRQLRDLRTEGKFITDESGRRYVNLSSNDYLGLSDLGLQRKFFTETDVERFVLSNPASRLMTGNSPEYTQLESSLAALWPGRTTLVLGSGYLANAGILPALAGKDDLILGDKLLHASVIDGLRIGDAEWKRFRHNDMNHLETLLRNSAGRYRTIWVATESVFSMDGDRAPLRDLAALKERYGFRIYLDEAHAFGVFGPSGSGCASESGVAEQIDIVVGTFGKALASYGAFVVADERTRRVLVNRMRTLIFSTALPPLTLLWSDFLVRRLPRFDNQRAHLQRLIAMLWSDPQATQIIPIHAGENRQALDMAEYFREAGFWTTAIRHPTVPRGESRIRISLTAALSETNISTFKLLTNQCTF